MDAEASINKLTPERIEVTNLREHHIGESLVGRKFKFARRTVPARRKLRIIMDPDGLVTDVAEIEVPAHDVLDIVEEIKS